MIKREASFTVFFRHYLKKHPIHASCAFEVKQTTGTSIPFDAVMEHQADALLNASKSPNGLLYKIPDDSMGYKPFDLLQLWQAPSYVVIRFPKEFHIIGIETFLKEKSESKRKSLTNERAREISVRSVKLKK